MTLPILDKKYLKMAPCLIDGPLSQAGIKLVTELKLLGNSTMAVALRAWAAAFLYNEMEKALADESDPTGVVLASFTTVLDRSENMRSLINGLDRISSLDNRQQDQSEVGFDHFGTLFTRNISERFWQQPYNQLAERLKRNGVDLDMFKDATVIDIGCGSGRNTFVLKDLGAKKVIGIDVSQAGIALAQKRQKELGITDNLEFRVASALQLPFDDNSFDITFSMGVFHHTPDWKKGFSEMYRVTKPHGTGLLMYLNEKPGGLCYDVIEILRCIVDGDNQRAIQNALETLDISSPTIIKILDPLLCEINTMLTTQDIEQELNLLGAENVKRFNRGSDSDHIEKIKNNFPHAQEKFGVGEQRYIFTKSDLAMETRQNPNRE